jgi:hypothetical protein
VSERHERIDTRGALRRQDVCRHAARGAGADHDRIVGPLEVDFGLGSRPEQSEDVHRE